MHHDIRYTNEATDWRFALAERLAAAYAHDPNVQVVMIAGSVGRGTADRYSDIQVDVYRTLPPSEADRRAAVARCGATLELLAEDADKWEDQMSLGGVHATSSTFLMSTMERYLADVVDRGESAPVAQVRLHALQHAVTVKGARVVRQWRSKAATYPARLMHAMLHAHLPLDSFWHDADKLAARNDLLLLYRRFVEVEQAILGALLGLNRLYLPTPEHMQGMNELIDALAIKPLDLAVRLQEAFRIEPVAGVQLLKAIIAEVLALVETHLPAFDTMPYRLNTTKQPQVWDEPPPGLALCAWM